MRLGGDEHLLHGPGLWAASLQGGDVALGDGVRCDRVPAADVLTKTCQLLPNTANDLPNTVTDCHDLPRTARFRGGIHRDQVWPVSPMSARVSEGCFDSGSGYASSNHSICSDAGASVERQWGPWAKRGPVTVCHIWTRRPLLGEEKSIARYKIQNAKVKMEEGRGTLIRTDLR